SLARPQTKDERLTLTKHLLIFFLRNLSTKISSVHPFIYITIYLFFIPVFALIYRNIPSGFYAPYAQFEYAGKSDAYRVGEAIQTALRRQLASRKAAVADKEPKVKDVYVQRLSAADSVTLKFDLLTMIFDS